ncbi:MAG: TolC family protein [Paludibacter sp.]|nr:TolC family protein [Paludibacter sp.]
MKKLILFPLLLLLCQVGVKAQSLSIEICQEKAKANYPLVKQYGLIEQTAQYNISNANKGYLPQLSISAKATYQSAVTQIPSSLGDVLSKLTGKPFSFPALPKDQYQAVIEATQVIWDGGVISTQNKITGLSKEVEKQKLEVDLYALKDRVNQLYFGILLLNEQLRQNDILKNDLLTNYNRLNAYKQNGIAYQADLDALNVEQLNTNQREADLKGTRRSFSIMLSALTGLDIHDRTELSKPTIDLAILKETSNHRPELSLFEAQANLYESQKSLLYAGNRPKVGAFVQGGYGQPGLNMFTIGFSPFYIGGVRLSWNISGLYTQKNNLNKIDLSKKTVDIQKETFEFNNNLVTRQQQTEIEKLQSTLANDDQIIKLRGNIKKAATSKMENGTASVSDLIREINAENQAIQLKSLHEIQLLMNVYQLKNIINN